MDEFRSVTVRSGDWVVLPVDDSLPTDPVGAVLRSVAVGRGDGDAIVGALRASVVEIACDVEGRPLIASAPDDVPCVVVASAAVHRRRGPG